MIKLHVLPTFVPVDMGVFKEVAPRYAIALDGFVSGPPEFDAHGPFLNLNHHDQVSRLDTRATCVQALLRVRAGIFKHCFKDEQGNPHAHLYVNDCDEDVATSVFVLQNAHLTEHVTNPILNRFVFMEDMLDSSSGTYPFHRSLPALEELAWVYDPYRRFRVNGGLDKRRASDFEGVITDVCNRIQAHITGHSGSQALDTRYTPMGGGMGWTLLTEEGANARTGIFSDGIRAFVSVRQRPDNRTVFTFCRAADFVPFPIPAILEALNREEGCTEDRFGGGDLVGGSPRVAGSALTVERVAEIVEEECKKYLGFTSRRLNTRNDVQLLPC